MILGKCHLMDLLVKYIISVTILISFFRTSHQEALLPPGGKVSARAKRETIEISIYSDDKKWKCPEAPQTVCFYPSYDFACKSHDECPNYQLCCLFACSYGCVRPEPVPQVVEWNYDYEESYENPENNLIDAGYDPSTGFKNLSRIIDKKLADEKIENNEILFENPNQNVGIFTYALPITTIYQATSGIVSGNFKNIDFYEDTENNLIDVGPKSLNLHKAFKQNDVNDAQHQGFGSTVYTIGKDLQNITEVMNVGGKFEANARVQNFHEISENSNIIMRHGDIRHDTTVSENASTTKAKDSNSGERNTSNEMRTEMNRTTKKELQYRAKNLVKFFSGLIPSMRIDENILPKIIHDSHFTFFHNLIHHEREFPVYRSRTKESSKKTHRYRHKEDDVKTAKEDVVKPAKEDDIKISKEDYVKTGKEDDVKTVKEDYVKTASPYIKPRNITMITKKDLESQAVQLLKFLSEFVPSTKIEDYLGALNRNRIKEESESINIHGNKEDVKNASPYIKPRNITMITKKSLESQAVDLLKLLSEFVPSTKIEDYLGPLNRSRIKEESESINIHGNKDDIKNASPYIKPRNITMITKKSLESQAVDLLKFLAKFVPSTKIENFLGALNRSRIKEESESINIHGNKDGDSKYASPYIKPRNKTMITKKELESQVLNLLTFLAEFVRSTKIDDFLGPLNKSRIKEESESINIHGNKDDIKNASPYIKPRNITMITKKSLESQAVDLLKFLAKFVPSTKIENFLGALNRSRIKEESESINIHGNKDGDSKYASPYIKPRNKTMITKKELESQVLNLLTFLAEFVRSTKIDDFLGPLNKSRIKEESESINIHGNKDDIKNASPYIKPRNITMITKKSLESQAVDLLKFLAKFVPSTKIENFLGALNRSRIKEESESINIHGNKDGDSKYASPYIKPRNKTMITKKELESQVVNLLTFLAEFVRSTKIDDFLGPLNKSRIKEESESINIHGNKDDLKNASPYIKPRNITMITKKSLESQAVDLLKFLAKFVPSTKIENFLGALNRSRIKEESESINIHGNKDGDSKYASPYIKPRNKTMITKKELESQVLNLLTFLAEFVRSTKIDDFLGPLNKSRIKEESESINIHGNKDDIKNASPYIKPRNITMITKKSLESQAVDLLKFLAKFVPSTKIENFLGALNRSRIKEESESINIHGNKDGDSKYASPYIKPRNKTMITKKELESQVVNLLTFLAEFVLSTKIDEKLLSKIILNSNVTSSEHFKTDISDTLNRSKDAALQMAERRPPRIHTSDSKYPEIYDAGKKANVHGKFPLKQKSNMSLKLKKKQKYTNSISEIDSSKPKVIDIYNQENKEDFHGAFQLVPKERSRYRPGVKSKQLQRRKNKNIKNSGLILLPPDARVTEIYNKKKKGNFHIAFQLKGRKKNKITSGYILLRQFANNMTTHPDIQSESSSMYRGNLSLDNSFEIHLRHWTDAMQEKWGEEIKFSNESRILSNSDVNDVFLSMERKNFDSKQTLRKFNSSEISMKSRTTSEGQSEILDGILLDWKNAEEGMKNYVTEIISEEDILTKIDHKLSWKELIRDLLTEEKEFENKNNQSEATNARKFLSAENEIDHSEKELSATHWKDTLQDTLGEEKSLINKYDNYLQSMSRKMNRQFGNNVVSHPDKKSQLSSSMHEGNLSLDNSFEIRLRHWTDTMQEKLGEENTFSNESSIPSNSDVNDVFLSMERKNFDSNQDWGKFNSSKISMKSHMTSEGQSKILYATLLDRKNAEEGMKKYVTEIISGKDILTKIDHKLSWKELIRDLLAEEKEFVNKNNQSEATNAGKFLSAENEIDHSEKELSATHWKDTLQDTLGEEKSLINKYDNYLQSMSRKMNRQFGNNVVSHPDIQSELFSSLHQGNLLLDNSFEVHLRHWTDAMKEKLREENVFSNESSIVSNSDVNDVFLSMERKDFDSNQTLRKFNSSEISMKSRTTLEGQSETLDGILLDWKNAEEGMKNYVTEIISVEDILTKVDHKLSWKELIRDLLAEEKEFVNKNNQSEATNAGKFLSAENEIDHSEKELSATHWKGTLQDTLGEEKSLINKYDNYLQSMSRKMNRQFGNNVVSHPVKKSQLSSSMHEGNLSLDNSFEIRLRHWTDTMQEKLGEENIFSNESSIPSNSDVNDVFLSMERKNFDSNQALRKFNSSEISMKSRTTLEGQSETLDGILLDWKNAEEGMKNYVTEKISEEDILTKIDHKLSWKELIRDLLTEEKEFENKNNQSEATNAGKFLSAENEIDHSEKELGTIHWKDTLQDTLGEEKSLINKYDNYLQSMSRKMNRQFGNNVTSHPDIQSELFSSLHQGNLSLDNSFEVHLRHWTDAMKDKLREENIFSNESSIVYNSDVNDVFLSMERKDFDSNKTLREFNSSEISMKSRTTLEGQSETLDGILLDWKNAEEGMKNYVTEKISEEDILTKIDHKLSWKELIRDLLAEEKEFENKNNQSEATNARKFLSAENEIDHSEKELGTIHWKDTLQDTLGEEKSLINKYDNYLQSMSRKMNRQFGNNVTSHPDIQSELFSSLHQGNLSLDNSFEVHLRHWTDAMKEKLREENIFSNESSIVSNSDVNDVFLSMERKDFDSNKTLREFNSSEISMKSRTTLEGQSETLDGILLDWKNAEEGMKNYVTEKISEEDILTKIDHKLSWKELIRDLLAEEKEFENKNNQSEATNARKFLSAENEIDHSEKELGTIHWKDTLQDTLGEEKSLINKYDNYLQSMSRKMNRQFGNNVTSHPDIQSELFSSLHQGNLSLDNSFEVHLRHWTDAMKEKLREENIFSNESSIVSNSDVNDVFLSMERKDFDSNKTLREFNSSEISMKSRTTLEGQSETLDRILLDWKNAEEGMKNYVTEIISEEDILTKIDHKLSWKELIRDLLAEEKEFENKNNQSEATNARKFLSAENEIDHSEKELITIHWKDALRDILGEEKSLINKYDNYLQSMMNKKDFTQVESPYRNYNKISSASVSKVSLKGNIREGNMANETLNFHTILNNAILPFEDNESENETTEWNVSASSHLVYSPTVDMQIPPPDELMSRGFHEELSFLTQSNGNGSAAVWYDDDKEDKLRNEVKAMRLPSPDSPLRYQIRTSYRGKEHIRDQFHSPSHERSSHINYDRLVSNTTGRNESLKIQYENLQRGSSGYRSDQHPTDGHGGENILRTMSSFLNYPVKYVQLLPKKGQKTFRQKLKHRNGSFAVISHKYIANDTLSSKRRTSKQKNKKGSHDKDRIFEVPSTLITSPAHAMYQGMKIRMPPLQELNIISTEFPLTFYPKKNFLLPPPPGNLPLTSHIEEAREKKQNSMVTSQPLRQFLIYKHNKHANQVEVLPVSSHFKNHFVDVTSHENITNDIVSSRRRTSSIQGLKPKSKYSRVKKLKKKKGSHTKDRIIGESSTFIPSPAHATFQDMKIRIPPLFTRFTVKWQREKDKEYILAFKSNDFHEESKNRAFNSDSSKKFLSAYDSKKKKSKMTKKKKKYTKDDGYQALNISRTQIPLIFYPNQNLLLPPPVNLTLTSHIEEAREKMHNSMGTLQPFQQFLIYKYNKHADQVEVLPVSSHLTNRTFSRYNVSNSNLIKSSDSPSEPIHAKEIYKIIDKGRMKKLLLKDKLKWPSILEKKRRKGQVKMKHVVPSKIRPTRQNHYKSNIAWPFANKMVGTQANSKPSERNRTDSTEFFTNNFSRKKSAMHIASNHTKKAPKSYLKEAIKYRQIDQKSNEMFTPGTISSNGRLRKMGEFYLTTPDIFDVKYMHDNKQGRSFMKEPKSKISKHNKKFGHPTRLNSVNNANFSWYDMNESVITKRPALSLVDDFQFYTNLPKSYGMKLDVMYENMPVNLAPLYNNNIFLEKSAKKKNFPSNKYEMDNPRLLNSEEQPRSKTSADLNRVKEKENLLFQSKEGDPYDYSEVEVPDLVAMNKGNEKDNLLFPVKESEPSDYSKIEMPDLVDLSKVNEKDNFLFRSKEGDPYDYSEVEVPDLVAMNKGNEKDNLLFPVKESEPSDYSKIEMPDLVDLSKVNEKDNFLFRSKEGDPYEVEVPDFGFPEEKNKLQAPNLMRFKEPPARNEFWWYNLTRHSTSKPPNSHNMNRFQNSKYTSRGNESQHLHSGAIQTTIPERIEAEVLMNDFWLNNLKEQQPLATTTPHAWNAIKNIIDTRSRNLSEIYSFLKPPRLTETFVRDYEFNNPPINIASDEKNKEYKQFKLNYEQDKNSFQNLNMFPENIPTYRKNKKPESFIHDSEENINFPQVFNNLFENYSVEDENKEQPKEFISAYKPNKDLFEETHYQKDKNLFQDFNIYPEKIPTYRRNQEAERISSDSEKNLYFPQDFNNLSERYSAEEVNEDQPEEFISGSKPNKGLFQGIDIFSERVLADRNNKEQIDKFKNFPGSVEFNRKNQNSGPLKEIDFYNEDNIPYKQKFRLQGKTSTVASGFNNLIGLLLKEETKYSNKDKNEKEKNKNDSSDIYQEKFQNNLFNELPEVNRNFVDYNDISEKELTQEQGTPFLQIFNRYIPENSKKLTTESSGQQKEEDLLIKLLNAEKQQDAGNMKMNNKKGFVEIKELSTKVSEEIKNDLEKNPVNELLLELIKEEKKQVGNGINFEISATEAFPSNNKFKQNAEGNLLMKSLYEGEKNDERHEYYSVSNTSGRNDKGRYYSSIEMFPKFPYKINNDYPEKIPAVEHFSPENKTTIDSSQLLFSKLLNQERSNEISNENLGKEIKG